MFRFFRNFESKSYDDILLNTPPQLIGIDDKGELIIGMFSFLKLFATMSHILFGIMSVIFINSKSWSNLASILPESLIM